MFWGCGTRPGAPVLTAPPTPALQTLHMQSTQSLKAWWRCHLPQVAFPDPCPPASQSLSSHDVSLFFPQSQILLLHVVHLPALCWALGVPK